MLNFPWTVARRIMPNADQEEFTRVSKFVLIGILNTFVGYGSFFILSFYMNYLIAVVISHFIGVTNSYVWNKLWTFKTRKNQLMEFVRFNAVYLVLLVVNIILMGILVDYIHLNPRIAQIFVLPVTTCVSYIGHKYFSFGIKR